MIFLSREIHITSSKIPFTEKRSEYYTYNACEDEVNRKVHLTKSQEAEVFYKTSCAMHRMQEMFIIEKKKQETSCD